jgi:hypothetical protein
MSELTPDQLNRIIEKNVPGLVEPAKIVLKHDHGMEPPNPF